MPFYGVAHVAYIPKKEGAITGLSKIARTVEGFARRPQLQERLTSQIADAIMDKLKPCLLYTSSLGSIVASLSAIIFVIAFDYKLAICVFVTIAALYVVYKHSSNIKRLINGTENKINWLKKFKRNN